MCLISTLKLVCTYVCVGYQYGRIPWGDADIAVLIDTKGTPKLCLHELHMKVLGEHTKAEVFDMVRDLRLPVEQGDTSLMRKLQALGLHNNRYVCVPVWC